MGDIFLQLIQGIGVTITVTVGAVLIGIVCGAPLAALRMSPIPVVSFPAATFVNVIRGIPPIVWLFIVFYGLRTATSIQLQPFMAAILTLGAIATAQFAEIYRGGLQSVRHGQAEAAMVLGLNRLQTFGLVRLPQALLPAIPAGATMAIGLIKESAVISIIGVQDITAHAASAAARSTDDIPIYLTAAALYIAISIPVALLARRVHAILERRVHAR